MKIETILLWGAVGYVVLVAIQQGFSGSGYSATNPPPASPYQIPFHLGADGRYYDANGLLVQ